MILNLLARAGVGALTIIDRDFIELTNLQRQVFFDERDLEQPKTLVAADKVRRANSDVVIQDFVKDLNLCLHSLFSTDSHDLSKLNA